MHKEVIGNTELGFRRVDSPDLLEEVFRLRYQVYCKECHFLKEEDCPEGIERDKYDPYSVHFVTEDRHGIIGTMRLIMDSPLGFPFEERCEGNLNIDISNIPRRNIAEVSRLLISKNYRKRSGGTRITAGRMRSIALGMYREMYQESRQRGITHWVAIMEKSLWTLLRLHNFVFNPIGEEIDFYGKVKPYLTTVEEVKYS